MRFAIPKKPRTSGPATSATSTTGYVYLIFFSSLSEGLLTYLRVRPALRVVYVPSGASLSEGCSRTYGYVPLCGLLSYFGTFT